MVGFVPGEKYNEITFPILSRDPAAKKDVNFLKYPIYNLLIISHLIFSTVLCNSWVGHGQDIFDVLKYGAKGDGLSDDTQAFEKAWNALCASNQSTAKLIVPAGKTFLLHQITLKGPCKSQNVNIKIEGTLLAPKRDAWELCTGRWLHFLGVRGMTVNGSGKIDGQGYDWWGVLNGTTGCKAKPTALLFERCDDLQIIGTTHVNGPGFHIYVFRSNNVTISHVTINSPPTSHNTDGIDVSNSVRVNILNSNISSGDDCIAIKGGTQFLNVNNITCGSGNHGISVGSLGESGQREFVEHVNVSNCIFNGGTSAARIKTWPGGTGYAKDISFQNINVHETDYPIFINQHYMHSPEKKLAVNVSDVIFGNIHGTSKSGNAVVLDCAMIGCDNITLEDINIISIDPKKPASSTCNNVKGKATKIISPPITCLSQANKYIQENYDNYFEV